MVLQGNIDVLLPLRDFYQALSENDQFLLGQQSSLDILMFIRQIDSFIYSSRMQTKRGQFLAGIISGKKTIVRAQAVQPAIQILRQSDLYLDSATFAKPSHREGGNIDNEYAERLTYCSGHCLPDFHISSCNICLCMFPAMLHQD